VVTYAICSHGATAPIGPGPLIIEASRSHCLDTPHSVGLLWTRDQPDTETSTWQHTTLTRERYQCPRRNSNPQSQQALDRTATGTGICAIIYIKYCTALDTVLKRCTSIQMYRIPGYMTEITREIQSLVLRRWYKVKSVWLYGVEMWPLINRRRNKSVAKLDYLIR
jgi:hypothetical protein